MRLWIRLQEGPAFILLSKQPASCQICNCLLMGLCRFSRSLCCPCQEHWPGTPVWPSMKVIQQLHTYVFLTLSDSHDEHKHIYSTEYTLTKSILYYIFQSWEGVSSQLGSHPLRRGNLSMGGNEGDRLSSSALWQDKRPWAQIENQEIQSEDKMTLLTVRVAILWNRLPRGAVEFPSVKVFKTWLDMLLGNLLYQVAWAEVLY